MKLSDIMSAMDLAAFAEVGLVIFMGVFLLVTLHVMRRDNAADWEQARRLPLSDDSARATRNEGTRR